MNLRQFVKFALWRDTTLHDEFRVLRRLVGPAAERAIVDVGANDGFYASNSYPFVSRGWRALLIEPHPAAFARLQARHASRSNATCLNLACGAGPGELQLWCGEDGDTTQATLSPASHPHFQSDRKKYSTTVRVRRLDDILVEQSFPVAFGILSIDTECWDHEVLKGLNLNCWRPRCIVTEDAQPAATAEKAAYLEANGYRRELAFESNSYWLRRCDGD